MRISLPVACALLTGTLVSLGCDGASEVGAPPAPLTGAIQLALDAPSAGSLSSATYTITGPSGYERSVTVRLGESPGLGTLIGGTPPGSGYALTAAGLASDGARCSGVSPPFDVVAGRTTVVKLALRCYEPVRSGGPIQVGGGVNFCPVIESLAATPGQIAVGGSVALASVTHDRDQGPAPLELGWLSSDGVFDRATDPDPRFTCLVPGDALLTLVITDGDCGDTRSITVTCVAPAADGGAAPDGGS